MPSNAQVIRNGTEINIPASDLVVGDLVVLTYGTKVPADVRIIETHDLKFDKSMLTGESDAIEGTVECTGIHFILKIKKMYGIFTIILNINDCLLN